MDSTAMRPREAERDVRLTRRLIPGRWIFAVSLALALSLGAGAQRARAATIAVDCTTDSSALATALATATDGDTLAIQGTCKGSFIIHHNLTLAGLGGTTLDGQGLTVLLIDGGLTVTVADLTITGGNGFFGGGISAAPPGTLTVIGSTITGNRAAFGGGISNGGVLTVVNSTISGNTATFGGGGITNHAGQTLTVDASTITGNSAGLGGGVVSDGTVTLENALVAANPSGGNCFSDGVLTDAGYNLDDDGMCGLSSVNHSLSNTNPLLDPVGLKDNGGPTPTIALLPGSPAIDAIPPSVNGCGTTLTTDQREVTRPQGSGCDIGAFELLATTVTVAIDIKPGGFPNAINPASNGTIPVAILSTDTFNAPAQVDTTSLKFGRTGNESSLAFCSSPQDVNGDGLADLVCHFMAQETGFQKGDTQGALTGKTVRGIGIRGTDSAVIVPS